MSKKQQYKGTGMIKASHFGRLYAGLTETEKKEVITRIDALVSENPQYCDEGNFAHAGNIFTCIALYEVLRKKQSKDAALASVSETLWDYAENKTAKTYRILFSLPPMLKVMGKLLPGLFARGSGYGWRYAWHTDTATDRYLQFECTSCIYAQLFEKYGYKELGPAFCDCDEINYGKIRGITFKRKHTLCKDAQPCDFLFVKEKGKQV